jgi:pyrroloquinoline quinone biosynthesis protein B
MNMRIKVLGAAAGGGFPQWNCYCHNCAAMIKDNFPGQARSQSSISVSSDGQNWAIINASPDIRQQILHSSHLKASELRTTPIKAIILIDSQIDHATGLLLLREGTAIQLYCTEAVYQDLTTTYPIINILQHYCGVAYHAIFDQQSFVIPDIAAIEFTPFALQGKAPPYSSHRNQPQLGDNIALQIKDTRNQKKVIYAPAVANITDAFYQTLAQADYIFIDGTFWTEDEMISQGINHKKAHDMGHIPQSGKNGLIAALSDITCPKTLIHINNTNPILHENSMERALLKRNGIDVAYDGMEITL